MMPRTWGTISAALAPWAMRATTRTVIVGAKAQAAEAIMNSVMPRKNIFRRPYMSPSRPPVMRPAVKATP